MTRDEGAKRSHPKWENLGMNALKKKPKSRSNFSNDRRLMKKEVPHRKVEEATWILKQEKQKEQASEIFTFTITIKLI